MIGMALDPVTHDIYLEDGQWARNSGELNVAQNVKTRLLLFQGELIYNINAGVPYYTEVFGATPSLNLIETLIKAEILGTEGVQQINTFSITLDKNTRKLSIDFTATSIYGDAEISDLTIIL